MLCNDENVRTNWTSLWQNINPLRATANFLFYSDKSKKIMWFDSSKLSRQLTHLRKRERIKENLIIIVNIIQINHEVIVINKS